VINYKSSVRIGRQEWILMGKKEINVMTGLATIPDKIPSKY